MTRGRHLLIKFVEENPNPETTIASTSPGTMGGTCTGWSTCPTRRSLRRTWNEQNLKEYGEGLEEYARDGTPNLLRRGDYCLLGMGARGFFVSIKNFFDLSLEIDFLFSGSGVTANGLFGDRGEP